MIHIVIGTKAQLIKTAPVMVELKKRKVPFNFIFTGQHKETMTELREIFKIKRPDVILYRGKDITSIGQMIIWSFKILLYTLWHKKEIFKNDREGIVLVHGDTFSTLLGALMGKIGRLKIGHIESGLRSFNLWHPFPEEITRLMVFRLSDVYFCPGTWAINNLKKYRGEKINTEANTLLDALNMALKRESRIKVDIPKEKYCLVSVHRFENIFNRKQFEKIIEIIEKATSKFKVLIIMHPPTKKNLHKFGFYQRLHKNKNIELRPRYDYFQFIKLINNSQFMMTDGGSNQEECYYLGHPCLLLREATERKEGLGENAILSKFRNRVIDNFIKNYENYQVKDAEIKNSPSGIIAQYLKANYLAEKILGIEYSPGYFNHMYQRDERQNRHFLDQVRNVMEMVGPIRKGEKILDLGTGNGTFAFECAKNGADVEATDLSKTAIKNCEKLRENKNLKNVHFTVASAHKQPFKNKVFDKIIMADLVEHLNPRIFKKSIQESRRLLKDNGKLYIYTPNKNHFFEKLRNRNMVLKKYPSHINMMDSHKLADILINEGFSINQNYPKSSHIPVFSFFEKVLMRVPGIGKNFQRRICMVAVKKHDEKIKEFYEDFHQLPNHPLNQFKEHIRYNILKNELKTANGKILVIGCGSKDEMGIIPRKAEGVGLDISEEAVKKSKKSYPRFKYTVGDATNLPFKNNNFDYVVSSEVIEHVPSDIKMLKEVNRVLKNGGQFIVTAPNWWSWFGLARLLGEKIFHKPFTADDQPIDNWVNPKKFIQKIGRNKFVVEDRYGIWYYPPTGKGNIYIPDIITMPFVYLFLPLEILSRKIIPYFGHTILVKAIKTENQLKNLNQINDRTYWQKRIKTEKVNLKSVGCYKVSDYGNSYIYKMVKERYNLILKKLDLPRNPSVLDAGCGIGAYIPNFIKNHFQKIVASDVSIDVLNEVRKKFPQVQIKQSAIIDLDYQDKTFDLVHCFDVLYHILDNREWRNSLKNLARLSKKYLILHEHFPVKKPKLVSKHLNPRTYKETRDLLKKCNFKEIYSIPTHAIASRLIFRLNNYFPKMLYKSDKFLLKKMDKNNKLNIIATHYIKVFERIK